MDIDVINGKNCLVFTASDAMRLTLRTIRADETMQRLCDEPIGFKLDDMKKRYQIDRGRLQQMERFGLFNMVDVSTERFSLPIWHYQTTTRADIVIESTSEVEIAVFVDRAEIIE